MTEQNKPVVALAKEHGLWPDHDEVKERFVDGAELKESIEAFAADLLSQNKQPPAEAGEGAVNKKHQLMRDACNAYIQPKGNMESRENSVIRKFKTRMEWENVCHPWAILELLDELSELKTSQTTATQAAVAAAMLKAVAEAEHWQNISKPEHKCDGVLESHPMHNRFIQETDGYLWTDITPYPTPERSE